MSHTGHSDSGHEELSKLVRTLTSLLHKFDVQKSPSKQPRDILPFLSHFTTLLTCSDEHDHQAKKVIAVTGSINSINQVRTLVVSQNPYLGSSARTISMELVRKAKRPLSEVVKGSPNAPLLDHIADVWAALSAFDRTASAPDYERQVESLELFSLSRSYRKFIVRFKEDITLCGGKRLYQVISEWRPDRREIAPKWVALPGWLLRFQGLPHIKSRTVQGQVQWEFSDDTKRAWSKILETILLKVDNAIEQTKTARGKSGRKAEEETRRAMGSLNIWCRVLCYFVVWDVGIVKSLLTETNMVAGITTMFMPTRGSNSAMDEADDDIAEFRQEPDESKGQQVFRYLKTVIAWHTAVHRLCRDTMLPKLLENLEIGLVEVPPSPSAVLTLPQISEAFFACFPDMTDIREGVLKVLKERHSETFSGCVHAEATLMGLVNFYGHESAYKNYGAMEDAQNMRNIIQPVADAGSAVIAVSKKCCWCCDWLGQNLETQFKLPGTHGIMYPWDPPVVGISASVLEKLEAELGGELYRAVLSTVEPAYSRHSSAASSPEGMHMDEMFSSFMLQA